MYTQGFGTDYYGRPGVAGTNIFYEVSVFHDNQKHGEDAVAVAVPKSKGEVKFVSAIDKEGKQRSQASLTEDKAAWQSVPGYFQNCINVDINGKVKDNSITITDPYRSGPYMCISVVDGATSALINGADPLNPDENGKPTPIDESLLTATDIATYAKALAKTYNANAANRPTSSSVNLLKMTVSNLAASEPYASANLDKTIVPTATFSSIKENSEGSELEVLVAGDQTAIIAYTDGTYDLICPDKGIKALENKRGEYIKEHYPQFKDFPAAEQKIIKRRTLEDIQRKANGEKYYAPFPEEDGKTVDKFVEEKQSVDINDNRTKYEYGNNPDIVHVVADKKKVARVILSTDGFYERAINMGIAKARDFISATDEEIMAIKRKIHAAENKSGKSHNDMSLVKVDVVQKSLVDSRIKARGVQESSVVSFKSSKVYPSGKQNDPKEMKEKQPQKQERRTDPIKLQQIYKRRYTPSH